MCHGSVTAAWLMLTNIQGPQVSLVKAEPWGGNLRLLGKPRKHPLMAEHTAGLTSGAIREPLPPRSTYQLVKGNCRPMRSSARQHPKSEITSQGQLSAETAKLSSRVCSCSSPLGPSKNHTRINRLCPGAQATKAWMRVFMSERTAGLATGT